MQPDVVPFTTVWIPAKSKNSKAFIWVGQRNEGEVSLLEVTSVTMRKGIGGITTEVTENVT